MEVYFQKPSLKLSFFQPITAAPGFTCLHTHDLDLAVHRGRVLYLYRDPVDTLFSLMSYHQQDLGDLQLVNRWADLYADHLDKWLIQESFTMRKVILRYEALQDDLQGEFAKVCTFFGTKLRPDLLDRSRQLASEHQVASHSSHDPHVINQEPGYDARRADFFNRHQIAIRSRIFDRQPELSAWFE